LIDPKMENLMSKRVSDFALIIGHVWRCNACRDALLEDPETTWIGYKLDETQRQRISDLEAEAFQTVMLLSEATGLTSDELYAAIDHPRARLRHLGSVKGDAYYIDR
jgi:hypothetical protein